MNDIIAVPFILLWFVFILMNWVSFYQTHVKRKFTSAIPLIGGVFGLIGFYQLPPLRKWCWVAVLLDYGSIVFLIALQKVTKELWQTSRINLVGELNGEDNLKVVKIRLYKAGVFVISHRISLREGQTGLVESSNIGTWYEADGTIVLTLHSDTVPLRQLRGTWKIERSFSHHGVNPNLDIQNIDFRQTLRARNR
jgi:hypothetical protein